MTFGLSPDGFNRKRLADIVTELEEKYRLIFGENIDVSPQSVFGQIIGIHAEREADLWEQAEFVYNAFYPSTAQGVQLSNVVTLNGIVRQEATKSTATITCTGTDGTVLPIGSIVSTSDTKEQFVSISAGTITGGTVSIAFESVNDGEIAAIAGTLTVIDTPIFGWETANNSNDAVLGQNEETDAELKERRVLSTQALGQNLMDSLFGQISNLDNVTDALVISNGTDGVVDGIPPNQFLTVVEGGDIEEIANAIWLNTPQGIDSHGSLTEVIIDSQGFSQNIKYSRPAEKNIYFKVTIVTDPATYPVSGDADVQAAIVNYGNSNFMISDDVILSQFYTPINTVPGIISIDLKIGLSASPTGTANIPVGLEEISKYDTTRVEMVVS